MQYILSIKNMKIYELVDFDDPVLRAVASEVMHFDDDMGVMLDRMLQSLYTNNGVGIAAPQLGISKRIFVLDLGKDDPIERPKGFYPKFCINPKIIKVSDNLIEGEEGCLSLPGISIKINRPETVAISFINYNGDNEELEAEGWLARACLHEIDHLNGKLAIDHASPLKRKFLVGKINKFLQKQDKK